MGAEYLGAAPASGAMAARRRDKKVLLQVPSVVALPAAYLVNTGLYRGTTLPFPYFWSGPPYSTIG
jgi:hypothetical protein